MVIMKLKPKTVAMKKTILNEIGKHKEHLKNHLNTEIKTVDFLKKEIAEIINIFEDAKLVASKKLNLDIDETEEKIKNKKETEKEVRDHFATAKAMLPLFRQHFSEFKKNSIQLQEDIDKILEEEKIFESLNSSRNAA